jgi:hypothetical protein
LYLTSEKTTRSKTIDKQIDRLIRAIAEANKKRWKEQPKQQHLKSSDTPKEVAAKAAKHQFHHQE